MNVHRKALKRPSGFMLIELSVVVGIIALIATGALMAMKIQAMDKAMQTTNEHMNTIKSALIVYKKQHGHLPCPAAVNAQPGTATYGIQAAQTVAVAPAQPEPLCYTSPAHPQNTAVGSGTWRQNNPAIAGGVNNTVRVGAVPFATLGISAQDSVDGWNNRFLYAVSEALADNTIPWDDTKGAITLLGDNNIVTGANPNHSPFVIISMGQSGAGAYTFDGKLRGNTCASSGLAQENCDGLTTAGNATFLSTTYSNVTNAARFDNIVASELGSDDPSRICGNQGMIFGPGYSQADTQGCVPPLQVDNGGNTTVAGSAVVTGLVTIVNNATVAGNANIITGNLGIGMSNPIVPLEVNGAIKITDSGVLCNATTLGVERFNSDKIQICTSTGWVEAGTGGTPTPMAAMTCPNGEFVQQILADGTSICTAPKTWVGADCVGGQASGDTWTVSCPAGFTLGSKVMMCFNGVTSVFSNSCKKPPVGISAYGKCPGPGSNSTLCYPSHLPTANHLCVLAGYISAASMGNQQVAGDQIAGGLWNGSAWQGMTWGGGQSLVSVTCNQ